MNDVVTLARVKREEEELYRPLAKGDDAEEEGEDEEENADETSNDQEPNVSFLVKVEEEVKRVKGVGEEARPDHDSCDD